MTVDTNEGPRKASWLGHQLQNDTMVDMVLSSITAEVKESEITQSIWTSYWPAVVDSCCAVYPVRNYFLFT